MQIHFEDHGQDFLVWTVDQSGVVTDSQPCQASVWQGCRVLRHAALAVGDCVVFRSPDGKRTLSIRYPIARIDTLEAQS